MQYDLFESTEISHLRNDLENLQKSQSNMRRGLFARHNELQRLVEELRSELSHIKQISANKKAELVPFFGEYMEISK